MNSKTSFKVEDAESAQTKVLSSPYKNLSSDKLGNRSQASIPKASLLLREQMTPSKRSPKPKPMVVQASLDNLMFKDKDLMKSPPPPSRNLN